MSESINGGFGVPGEKDDGRKGIDSCIENELCLGNTYSEHNTLFKRTRMVRSRDRLEAMIIIDVVLVEKDMLGYVQYMRAVRGVGQGLSDHQVVLCKDS